jgi:hypothetical protein
MKSDLSRKQADLSITQTNAGSPSRLGGCRQTGHHAA